MAFFGTQPVYRLWATIAEHMPAGVISIHEQAADEAIFAEITNVQSKVKNPMLNSQFRVSDPHPYETR